MLVLDRNAHCIMEVSVAADDPMLSKRLLPEIQEFIKHNIKCLKSFNGEIFSILIFILEITATHLLGLPISKLVALPEGRFVGLVLTRTKRG